MNRVGYLTCGLLAMVFLAPFGVLLGAPDQARAIGPTCSYGRCDGADAAGRSFAARLFRLQNAERRRHGLRPLRPNRLLARAARRHARDMVRRHYFGHVSPARHDVLDRVAATGYSRGRRFAAQENLYWWKPRQRPRAVLRAWMSSAVHRANVLGRRWSHLGVATVMRSPFGRGGITVVGVFGRR